MAAGQQPLGTAFHNKSRKTTDHSMAITESGVEEGVQSACDSLIFLETPKFAYCTVEQRKFCKFQWW